jgi:hypothetical protein
MPMEGIKPFLIFFVGSIILFLGFAIVNWFWKKVWWYLFGGRKDLNKEVRENFKNKYKDINL